MSPEELLKQVQRLVEEHRQLDQRIEQSKQILMDQGRSLARVIDAADLPQSEKDNLKRVIGA